MEHLPRGLPVVEGAEQKAAEASAAGLRSGMVPRRELAQLLDLHVSAGRRVLPGPKCDWGHGIVGAHTVQEGNGVRSCVRARFDSRAGLGSYQRPQQVLQPAPQLHERALISTAVS